MSGFLLDTNVPSKIGKPVPDPNVLRWLGTVEEAQTFLSVVSLGEMRKGCELLEPGSKRRLQLERWLEVEVRAWFEGRILPVTEAIAERRRYTSCSTTFLPARRKTWPNSLSRIRVFRFHFTPTYSSWLNQVEIWFAKIERNVIARGVFTSVKDLSRKLMKYIREYDKTATPFNWKYTNISNRIR